MKKTDLLPKKRTSDDELWEIFKCEIEIRSDNFQFSKIRWQLQNLFRKNFANMFENGPETKFLKIFASIKFKLQIRNQREFLLQRICITIWFILNFRTFSWEFAHAQARISISNFSRIRWAKVFKKCLLG